jgi:hypothetical protein
MKSWLESKVFFLWGRQERAEKEVRSRLVAAGRFMSWNEVENRLKSGEGTLIFQLCSPKGPLRDWWTEDDLITPAPFPLPTSMTETVKMKSQPLLDYANACFARYVAVEGGTAKLTEVPRREPWTKLTESYPQAKVVTLFGGPSTAFLYQGDVLG